MTQANAEPEPELEYECECGYGCRGATPVEQLLDAQRHALQVHGIDVTPQQVQAATSRGVSSRAYSQTKTEGTNHAIE